MSIKLAAAFVTACVALAVAGGVGASPANPFIGTWWVIDTTDGSMEQATFGADGALFFRDNSAHVCDGTAALAQDTGTASGNVWTGSGTAIIRCPADGGKTIDGVYFEFDLNSDGTLSSSATLPTEHWTRTRP